MDYINLMSFIIASNLPEPSPHFDYNQKEIDFCIAYVFSGSASNGTECAKIANYTANTDNSAAVTAHRLLNNDKIIDYISILKQHALSRLSLTRDKKLELLSKWAQETHYTGKDGTTLTRSQNMSAVDLHNKMTGEYDLSLADILGRIIYDVEFVTSDDEDAEDNTLLLE